MNAGHSDLHEKRNESNLLVNSKTIFLKNQSGFVLPWPEFWWFTVGVNNMS